MVCWLLPLCKSLHDNECFECACNDLFPCVSVTLAWTARWRELRMRCRSLHINADFEAGRIVDSLVLRLC